MTFAPTPEQVHIIDAPLGSQCVIACAGSGKTATAVRRLATIRRVLGHSRAYVALLSYSNTAVNTFRSEYSQLASSVPASPGRVHISTVDSFVASQILLPHAARLMGCNRRPFLVHGEEPFLAGHTVFNGTHGVPIEYLRAVVDENGMPQFTTKLGNAPATQISAAAAVAAIKKLSKAAAYTHQTGRYLAWRVLQEDGRLADILARRFPHILVDEAQDIGSFHGALLRILRTRGTTLSLIGDPHQAIFEFADADGTFLKAFSSEVEPSSLTINRRSVWPIVAAANHMSGIVATSARTAPDRLHGAFTFCYDPKNVEAIPFEFAEKLAACGYAASEVVILCRGRALLDKLLGATPNRGKGTTKRFALASIVRDGGADAIEAFEFLAEGVCSLLEKTPAGLQRELIDGAIDPTVAAIRRVLWRFLRDPVNGLPAASLAAKNAWQPLLKTRISSLLKDVCKVSSYTASPTWKKKITVAGLPEIPLLELVDPGLVKVSALVKTVHDVKGEGIPTVIYLAKKGDLTSLLQGPVTEDGRIGYVAITRARDLLLIGVPKGAEDLLPMLASKGVGAWAPPVPLSSDFGNQPVP